MAVVETREARAGLQEELFPHEARKWHGLPREVVLSPELRTDPALSRRWDWMRKEVGSSGPGTRKVSGSAHCTQFNPSSSLLCVTQHITACCLEIVTISRYIASLHA